MSDLISILQENLPKIQDENQKASLQNAIQLGVPSMKNEEWKYTYYNKILQQGFKPVLVADQHVNMFKMMGSLTVEKEFIDEYSVSENRIVFVNGVFHSELSSFINHPQINLWNTNNVSENITSDFLLELNNAFASDGIFLEIGDHVVVNDLIEIFYIHTKSSDIIQLKNKIIVGKNSQVKLAEYYINYDEAPAYLNIVTEMQVAENAHTELYKIQDGGKVFNITDNTFVKQDKSSVCTVNTISLTGGITRNILQFDVNGERAETHMNGLYLLENEEHVDNRTLVNHNVANCESNELYKGILGGKSTGVFNGKIVVKQAAQKTNAFQSNRNLLLSNDANIYTKPQLEIFADDVKCSHGATSSQIEDSELFYLQARGIGKEVARGLLVYAFAAEVVENIKNELLRNKLQERIAELLKIEL
ncbi:MAG: Fe-S cluster assembly protein SufD [Bacteroidota bacterium]|nr:Fe-S cluster assembly protein SufD [Bacteroidota bacterium]